MPKPRHLVADQAAVIWQHLGYILLSPYKPIVMSMTTRGGAAAVPGTVPLEAVGDFKDLNHLFDDFDFSSWWWAGLFLIWESQAPLGEFVPSQVEVAPMSPPVLFWRAGRYNTRQQRQPTPAGAIEDAPADIEQPAGAVAQTEEA